MPRRRLGTAAAILTGLAAAAAAVVAHAAPVSGQGSWESVLHARDLNGDGVADAYYDSSRNLSWAADANPIGLNDWQTTRDWVAALSLHGVSGWRLPTMVGVSGGFPVCTDYTYDGSGDCGYNVDPTRSELAHLYQVVLGNLPELDTAGGARAPGWGLTNTGPFDNLIEGDYPTALTLVIDNVPQPGLYVWLFETTFGYQDHGVAADPSFSAWAVHDGDVGAVPTPGSAALLSIGLVLLAGRNRARAPQRRRNGCRAAWGHFNPRSPR